MLEDQGNIYTIASAETLDEAGKLAADAMLDFLTKRSEKNVNELILLMSLMTDMEVCQVVDPLMTARMRLRPGVLDVRF